jgi:hypothetical protein
MTPSIKCVTALDKAAQLVWTRLDAWVAYCIVYTELWHPKQTLSKSLRGKTPACIKERLSTSAHITQSTAKKRKRETTETDEDRQAGCQPCDPACA